ncbi:BZ3500_MvSof-1268-A1-R1_Chr2-2g04842 [Microbotryum saponariae]|uniref:Defect at low temperature protein 1 n=1 Tax=Microbotryum saponariae TaxID=289078 RepID=A0A2X0KA88_9BASI|nr:BZ3500_MvSof-1268-A1-R1_Chr2-2g04842 [Microbotryum saponariae]SDA00299.1 BZ3501_MvSof-1269-A2-R1_Chr2-2g04516 [Microbotryum saponariae]
MKRPKVKELRQAVATTRRYTYPHRPRTDYHAIARRAALLFVVILIIAALLTALYDIGVQVPRSTHSSKISDLVLVLGAYVAVILIGISIMISRRFALSKEYTSIPKGYIPIQSTDVPQPAFDLISNEYDRAAVITHISQPRHRTQQGWGRPGTPHENVHFRTSILATIPALESTLSSGPLSSYHSTHSRSSPLSPLTPLLKAGVLPPPIVAVAQAYEQILQRARYGVDEPTEKDYDDMVRYVAVLMGMLERIGAVRK